MSNRCKVHISLSEQAIEQEINEELAPVLEKLKENEVITDYNIDHLVTIL